MGTVLSNCEIIDVDWPAVSDIFTQNKTIFSKFEKLIVKKSDDSKI